MKNLALSLLFVLCPAIAVAASGPSTSFEDAQALFESMTPQQQAAVMKQAEAYKKELEAMNSKERTQVIEQHREVADTLKIDQIDPSKLDTENIQSLDITREHLDEYQEKYDAGEIDNSAVKSKGDL